MNLQRQESNLQKLVDHRAAMSKDLAAAQAELKESQARFADALLDGKKGGTLLAEEKALDSKIAGLTSAIDMSVQREKDSMDKLRELRRKDAIERGQVIVRDCLTQIREAEKHVRALDEVRASLEDAGDQLYQINGIAYTADDPSYFRPEIGMLISRPQQAIKALTEQFGVQSKAEKRYREVYPRRL